MDALTADGRRLRLHAFGHAPDAATDLVVCEAGLGAGGRTWGPLAARLPGTLAVVGYDRAGYGGSDPAPGPRGPDALADDLDAVVASLPASRVIVVGHSWGGPIARTWASALLAGRAHGTSPDRLAGLVLADPSDEHMAAFFSPASRAASRLQDALYPPLARSGLLARLNRRILAPLPEPDRSAAVAEISSADAARAVVAENRAVIPGLDALRRPPLDLGDLPVTVISGTRASWLDRRLRAQVVAAHRAAVASWPRGRHVEAPGAGHLVPLEAPGVVADAVLALLGRPA